MSEEYKGKRGEAWSYLPQLVDEGLSNTEIVGWLRENDLSYRTQNMYADINRFRLENFGASFIKSMNEDAPIPDKYMRTWHGNTEFDYRVVVKYEYMDTSTNTVGTTGTTLYFDHPPSQSEVSELFDVRKQSIQNLYNNVQEVYSAVNVYYYKNER